MGRGESLAQRCSQCSHAARRIAGALTEAAFGQMSWSWRLLSEFNAYSAARRAVALSLSSAVARQSLRAAYLRTFPRPVTCVTAVDEVKVLRKANLVPNVSW